MTYDEAIQLFGVVASLKRNDEAIWAPSIVPVRVARRGNDALHYEVRIERGPAGTFKDWRSLYELDQDFPFRPYEHGVMVVR